jgi:hypothetical protein
MITDAPWSQIQNLKDDGFPVIMNKNTPFDFIHLRQF